MSGIANTHHSQSALQDCYFYMTSVCTKGTSCPFRHNEAAKTAIGICPQWLNSTCNNPNCPLKHSIFKNRAEIECYWETHGGCKKADCPFRHSSQPSTITSTNHIHPPTTSPSSSATTIHHPLANGSTQSIAEPARKTFSPPKSTLEGSQSPSKRTIRALHGETQGFSGRKKPIEPLTVPTVSTSGSNNLNFEVKSFEEIMREKRRKAQAQAEASSVSENPTSDLRPESRNNVNQQGKMVVEKEIIKTIDEETSKSDTKTITLPSKLTTTTSSSKMTTEVPVEEIDIDQEMEEIEKLINS